VNLGTGHGASVLDVIAAFERACGHRIAVHIGPRRPGDAPAYWADVQHAQDRLGWRAQRSLDQMCADSWRWQLANPRGFDEPMPGFPVRAADGAAPTAVTHSLQPGQEHG
jgi:UDP-glucose 4-epimerase